MSMLVGVRGQTRESEGAALREGIIQQPGPFYNGNPSSIIWGNSPAAPLWRDESSASAFSSSASSGFGNSKQRVQKEEKEKDVAGMVAGEGKASLKGRRHVSRSQLARHLNPNPNSSLSSPFAFGFPPQPPPGSTSSSISGFGQFPISPVVAPGSAFVAFGAGSNYNPGASGIGADAFGALPGGNPSAQDERMEDIEEMIPSMASLALNNNQPLDSRVSVKVEEHRPSSGAAKNGPSPWASGSDGSGQFSSSVLNSSTEPSIDRKDAAGIFVFGAKPPSKLAASSPPEQSVAQAPPPPRSRTVKVKRSVSAAKGKGIAAGNGAFSAPSPTNLHLEGSEFASGECSFSQPTVGFRIPPVGNAEWSSDDSSSRGFASSSSLPAVSADAFAEGIRISSAEGHSPSDSDHGIFSFPEIARGSNFSGESNARSNLPFVAENLVRTKEFSQAPTIGNNSLLPSAFSRVSSTKDRKDEISSSAQSVAASLAGLTVSDKNGKNVSGIREFAPGHSDVKVRVQSVEDLSSGFALKFGLGSVGISSDKEVTADSSVFVKSGKPSTSKTVGSSKNEATFDSHLEFNDPRIPRGNRGGEKLQSSSAAPIKTVDSFRVEVEPKVDVQKPSFHAFTHEQSEPFSTRVRSEPFVFGASRPQPTSTGPEVVSPSTTFKFAAQGSPSPPSMSSSTGGGCVSRSASISVSDLLSFKHKAPAAYDSSASSQPDADSVTSSFLSLNLAASKPSVKADGVIKLDGVAPDVPATPIHRVASSGNVKYDSDADCTFVSAASHFVFQAGSASTSPSLSQATAPITSAAKGLGASAAAADIKVKVKASQAESSVTPDFFDAQSMSQSNSTGGASFEFRANGGDSGAGGKSSARKKSHKTPLSAPRRQTRSMASSKDKNASGTFINFVDITGTPDEAGSPMDFSPQRYTPPDDTLPDTDQIAKQAAWSRSQTIEKERHDGDDEWAQYSETDVRMENLRNAASDLNLGSKQGGHTPWEGIGKGEDDSFWWGGKESSPRKVAGRNGKWKRTVFDENQVPLSDRDNTWADIKMGSIIEPESAASSSTPSVDSSASSSGWGLFTFTAGTSPNFSSTTSILRRHARKIHRERPAPGFSEAMKWTSSKVRGETISSPHVGGAQFVGENTMGGTTAMKRPVFAFDAQANLPAESGKGFYGKVGNWASEQLKAPGVVFSSRSNSWSTESSSSLGSLARPDGTAPTGPQTAGAAATEQVCERWRLRGNQAYANGDFPKAEEYYSRGASSVPPNETSQSCIRASMLCYSNRAATRMVVGRICEALADCILAITVDPNFLRVRLRAASCHLSLGQTDSAVLAFKECIRRAKEDDQPDVKVSSEASEGLRKSLQVEEYLNLATEILSNWSSGDTPAALRLLNEALLSSPHSECALQLKCRALLLLRRYDEVVQLCEQSLITAERNHPLASADLSIHQLLQADTGGDIAKQEGIGSPLKLWRWQLTAKAKYHLGRLEESLEILQNLEVASVIASEKSISTGILPNADPLVLSIASIRDLLRHKAAGNEAFQNGKHTEAVEHYSAALACNGDSRPFNAVCFCNRAAASQALGNIGDAIADCSRAIALDPKYAKAISRRATLHEKVRDYGQSCHDLQRLISLLESQQQQARSTLSPGRVGRVTTNTHQDLRQARDRLAKAEDEMKKGHPLDHYMILGLEPGCSSNEIKKAYRKAALRHHPDKAGQFLSRSEGGDDGGLWKEVGDEARRDAERLFKLIGEANAILSDTQKRTRYDAEEEFRKLRTRTSSATAGLSEVYRSTERGQGGVGRRPRERYDSWSGYVHQHQRWQSGPDAAQPDTYARRGRYGSNNSSRSNGDGGRWTEFDWDDI